MEGEANLWWQWLERIYHKKRKNVRWKDFEKEVLIRFGPTGYIDYDEALSRIKQIGSLRDYLVQFERLSTQVQGWSEKALIGTFTGGLKPELSKEVKVSKPRTLRQAIEYARLQDDYLAEDKRGGRGDQRKSSFSNQEGKPTSTPGTTSKPLPVGVKKLTWEEMKKNREKGLCFNCDEKFVPGHRCKVSQVFLIEPIAENSSDAMMEEDEDHNDKGDDYHDKVDHQISVHALTGTKGPKTMKIQALVFNRQVTVLIDNGSSHNFINSEIASKLQLPVDPVEPFEVRVASGDKLTCSEIYKDVPIKMQGIHLQVSLYALPLIGLDIVLGVQWLEELGRVVSDYGKMTMEFAWGDGWVKLAM